MRLADLYRERAARAAGAGPYKSIISRLAEAHWLPDFSATYNDYQIYLMQLWLPSACSLLVYTLYHDGMVNVSTAEVVSPFVVYALLIAYVSMISGFEPSRLVLRRLNPELSDDAQRNELQAVFAFRAHTPEGHCVDQIGKVRRAPGPSLPATLPPPECCRGSPLRRTPPRARAGPEVAGCGAQRGVRLTGRPPPRQIADTLFQNRFERLSWRMTMSSGTLHALIPAIHRMMNWHRGRCLSSHMPWWTQVYFWICGGTGWAHAFVSLPATAVSGFAAMPAPVIIIIGRD